MAKSIARYTALGALFLVPLTPLVVSNSFFFPFITGKAFFFRIVVEVAVCAWAALAIIDREYRPRFSWIGVVALAFVTWMFIANLAAVNVEKAFWSNFERMEGWVMLVHLLGLFFAASSVLGVEKKWRAWFTWSLGVSLVVSLYALIQLGGGAAIHQGSTRIDASFGNSAYLAIYLLFNTFIAGWLALTEGRSWLKWTLIALAVLEGILVFFTETRGTVLGLVGGLLLAALLTALTAGKKARTYALAALLVLVVAVGSFALARDSAFVENNHVLQRVTSISLSDGQTRFTIWHMAWQGFLERPVTGWGQEGFNYVFNKYYDPSLYTQEAWFDRAHNAFIDWLMAGGLPAFLLYLGLFGTAIVLLWKSSTLSRAERIALTAALTGYVIHNLFVFDNLYAYVYFFAVLALIHSQTARPIAKLEQLPEVSGEGVATPVAVGIAVAFVLMYVVNASGVRAATELITAISPSAAGPQANLQAFQNLLQHPAFAAQEIREQLVSFDTSVVQSSSVPDALKQQIATLTISEMQKQLAAHPGDAREVLELAVAYRAAGDIQNSLAQMQAALALSPKKEQILIQAGATAWSMNDPKTAQAYFEQAYALAPQFSDLAAYAAAGDIAVGDGAASDKVLLAAFGTTTVDSDVLAYAYFHANDYPRLIALWKLRTQSPSADASTWFGLAAAYYVSGDSVRATATIQTAVKLFPGAADEAKAFLQQMAAQAGS